MQMYIMVPWTHSKSISQMAPRSVYPFLCAGHNCDQHMQTTDNRGDNRPHLATSCVQCSLLIVIIVRKNEDGNVQRW